MSASDDETILGAGDRGGGILPRIVIPVGPRARDRVQDFEKEISAQGALSIAEPGAMQENDIMENRRVELGLRNRPSVPTEEPSDEEEEDSDSDYVDSGSERKDSGRVRVAGGAKGIDSRRIGLGLRLKTQVSYANDFSEEESGESESDDSENGGEFAQIDSDARLAKALQQDETGLRKTTVKIVREGPLKMKSRKPKKADFVRTMNGRTTGRVRKRTKRLGENDSDVSSWDSSDEELLEPVMEYEIESPKGPIVERIFSYRKRNVLVPKKRASDESKKGEDNANTIEMKDQVREETQKGFDEAADVVVLAPTLHEPAVTMPMDTDGGKVETANGDIPAIEIVSDAVVKLELGGELSSKPVMKHQLHADEHVAKLDSQQPADDEELEEVEVEEFLVKYKGMAYIHCEWVPLEQILAEKQGKGKVKRFMEKRRLGLVDTEEEPFNDDFEQIDRIVARRSVETDEVGPTGSFIHKWQYLVKWRSLSYEDATWEFPEDFNDDEKIRRFERVNDPRIRQAELAVARQTQFVPFANSPEYKDENELRDYQIEGLNWLAFSWHQNRNVILADEMGLGKTVQAIAIFDYLRKFQGICGPFLVIAPLSTIPHWQRTVEGWSDMNCVVYHGSQAARRVLVENEFYYRNYNQFKFHIVITTYEMVFSGRMDLGTVRWKYLVLDEAHRIKNKSGKLITDLRTFHFDHCLLMTGTPLQNNVEELWTILNFMEPAKFSSWAAFDAEFGNLSDHNQVMKLHSLLAPHLLRRMKEHVEKSIAPKQETIVEVELTTLQKKYYRAIYERNFSFLKKSVKTTNLPSLMNIMMELRKVCNHPYLVRGVEEAVMADALSDGSGMQLSHSQQMHLLIRSSGKMVLLDKLLPRLKEQGHRVLIFSQMVRVLDILEDFLLGKSYKYERIDGRVRGNERQEAIDRFSKDESDRFVFLLCTRAGGLGINLTAADTVVIFDSDWNPQGDVQAQARCHRIGQEKLVKVYRLLTKGTYERTMFERASRKLGLDQAVLGKYRDQTPGTSEAPTPRGPTAASEYRSEIDRLLKYGAYDVFREEDDTAANKFCEADIDSILAERAVEVTHDTASGTLSTEYSKASFVANEERQIDLEDPDFWEKLLPQEALQNDPLIQYLPRSRRTTQRFGISQSSDSEGSGEEWGSVGSNSLPAQLEDGRKCKRKPWTKLDRARLLAGLRTFGLGRWYRYQEIFPKRMRADMEHFARELSLLTWRCCDHAEEIESKLAEEFGEDDVRLSLDCEVTKGRGRGRARKKAENERGNGAILKRIETKRSAMAVAHMKSVKPVYRELLFPAEDILWETEFLEYLQRNGIILLKQIDLLSKLEGWLSGYYDDVRLAWEDVMKEPYPMMDECDEVIRDEKKEEDAQVIGDSEREKRSPTEECAVPVDDEAKDVEEVVQEDEEEKAARQERRIREVRMMRLEAPFDYIFYALDEENQTKVMTALEARREQTREELVNGFNLSLPRPMFDWWTRKMDDHIMLGTWLHGFGRYDAIAADPRLAFASCTRAPSEHSRGDGNEDLETKEELEKELKIRLEDISKEQQDKKPEFPSSNVVIRRLRQLLAFQVYSQSVKEGTASVTEERPEEASARSPMDREGTNEEVLSVDAMLENKGEGADATVVPSDPGLRENQPSESLEGVDLVSLIQQRVASDEKLSRKLHRHMEKERRAEEKRRARADRKEAQATGWRKRDETTFLRAAMCYGIPEPTRPAKVKQKQDASATSGTAKAADEQNETIVVAGGEGVNVEPEDVKTTDVVMEPSEGDGTEQAPAPSAVSSGSAASAEVRKDDFPPGPSWEEQWESFAERAHLSHKPLALLQEFGAKYLEECKAVLSAGPHAAPRSVKESGKVQQSNSVVEQVAVGGAPTEAGVSGVADADKSRIEMNPSVTYKRAHIFFSRQRFFLRTLSVLGRQPEEKIMNVFAKASRASFLPDWYESGVHDLALLEGLKRHGFDLSAMKNDPDLPFRGLMDKHWQSVKEEHGLEDNDTTTTAKRTRKKRRIDHDDDDLDDDDMNDGGEDAQQRNSDRRKKESFFPFLSTNFVIKRMEYLKNLVDPPLSKLKFGQSSNDPFSLDLGHLDSLGGRDEKRKRGGPRKKGIVDIDEVIFCGDDLPRTPEGDLILPFRSGSSIIHCLGEIVPHPAWHSDRTIFPRGYKSEKQYFSQFTLDTRVNYTSEIKEAPGGGPLFVVTAEDDSTHPIESRSASGAWLVVAKAVDALRRKRGTNVTISGTESFALAHQRVLRLIQDMEGADKCINYRMKNFTARNADGEIVSSPAFLKWRSSLPADQIPAKSGDQEVEESEPRKRQKPAEERKKGIRKRRSRRKKAETSSSESEGDEKPGVEQLDSVVRRRELRVLAEAEEARANQIVGSQESAYDLRASQPQPIVDPPSSGNDEPEQQDPKKFKPDDGEWW